MAAQTHDVPSLRGTLQTSRSRPIWKTLLVAGIIAWTPMALAWVVMTVALGAAVRPADILTVGLGLSVMTSYVALIYVDRRDAPATYGTGKALRSVGWLLLAVAIPFVVVSFVARFLGMI